MPQNQVPHLVLRQNPHWDSSGLAIPATCQAPLTPGLWPCLQRDGLFKGSTSWGWDRAVVAGGTGPMLRSGLASELERGGPFHFYDAVDGQLQGSVELTALGQGKISGGAAVSGSSSASMNVCTLRVDPNTWETMHQER